MTNPAGIVFDFVVHGRELQKGKLTVRDALADLFGLDENPKTADVLIAMSFFILTIEDAKKQLAADPTIDHTLYLRPFDALEAELSKVNLDGPWANLREPLGHLKMGIQFAADYLRRAEQFKDIENETLREITLSVSELLADLELARITPELKALLVDAFEDVLLAIRLYRIRGVPGLHDAFLKTVGTLVTYHEDFAEAAQDPTNKNIFRKMGQLVATINGTLELARKISALPGAIGRLISFLGSPGA